MSDLPPPPPPPPPGAYPPPMPNYGPMPYPSKAGPWIRFLARIIDALVLLIPSVIITVAFALGSARDGFANGFENSVESWIASLITTAMSLGYYVWLESSRGQTLGKMATTLHVQGPRGGNPTPEEAFRRNAWTLLGLIPLIGGFASLAAAIAIGVTISSDTYGRGVHDSFAGGTIVQRGR